MKNTEKLTLDTKLYRAPEFTVRVDTSNNVRIQCEGRTFQAGHDALRILNESHNNLSIKELIEKTSSETGAYNVQNILGTLSVLMNGGVLSTERQRFMSTKPFPRGGYDAPYIHLKILNDTKRKSAFVSAVRKAVNPDDIVLDLGTGSGILAVAAAQAGAKKVIAVEPAGMVDVAAAIAEANGVADRIEFIKGWSTALELDEPATLLTTDIVGNDPFDMLIWETLEDARKRLLSPTARLIPEKIDIFARVVEIPSSTLNMHQASDKSVEKWRNAYGMDFSLLKNNDTREYIGWYERPEDVMEWQPISEPILLGTCSLHDDFSRFSLSANISLESNNAKRANGLLIYFGVSLIKEYFTSDPWMGGVDSHWYTSVWAAANTTSFVDDDNTVRFNYKYIGDGISIVEGTK